MIGALGVSLGAMSGRMRGEAWAQGTIKFAGNCAFVKNCMCIPPVMIYLNV